MPQISEASLPDIFVSPHKLHKKTIFWSKPLGNICFSRIEEHPFSITNDYWSYIIWHEIDDDTDFDRDYCKMVQDMKADDVQRMAQQLLAAKRCIEVTMLSE